MYQGLTLAGRYRLDSLLGQGGMGQVWRGTDIRLDRPIAVKLLPLPNGADHPSVARFSQEARITASLQHSCITVVFDIDRHEERLLFLVMELLEGTDLATLMEGRKEGLPLPRVVGIGLQVAEALEAAHARGIVHRDVKPANVILLPGDKVKICDFGIARYQGAASHLTGANPVGTPAFMAPEQFENSAEVDGRADLYALGGLLYVLLTARPTFEGRSLMSLMRAVLNEPPPDPATLRPGLPPELAGLVVGLLAKDPADRPADASIVVRALRRLARTLPADDPEPATRRVPAGPDYRTALEFYLQDRYPEALPMLEALAPADTGRLEARGLYAWTLYWLDREREALPIAEEVATVRQGVLGPEDTDTLTARDLVARCLYTLGRYAEALPILEEVGEIRARVLGPDHPETLSDRNLTARALLRLGRADAALPVARQAARDRAKALGDDHPDTLASRFLMGRVLVSLHRYGEALPVVAEVARARAGVLGAAHPDTVQAAELAARLERRR